VHTTVVEPPPTALACCTTLPLTVMEHLIIVLPLPAVAETITVPWEDGPVPLQLLPTKVRVVLLPPRSMNVTLLSRASEVTEYLTRLLLLAELPEPPELPALLSTRLSTRLSDPLPELLAVRCSQLLCAPVSRSTASPAAAVVLNLDGTLIARVLMAYPSVEGKSPPEARTALSRCRSAERRAPVSPSSPIRQRSVSWDGLT
jgi:hypothetical protein